MASSSSSATAQVSKKYDVFISFRGEETRTTITGILHGRLHWEYHINVFMDDQLHKGDEISPSLLNTIEDSKISVIIFSESYASSRWCLEELVKIMECKKAYRQIVLPVFFYVDPSHIRNQTDTFGNGFARLVESFNKEKLEKLQMTEEQFRDKVQAWRNAMTGAANLNGYTVTRTTSLYAITQKIARDILEMLNYLSSEVDNNNLIAIEPSIDYIIKYLLDLGNYQLMARYSNRRIGIWGMGGIGKTTIAEAVYNKIWPMFEASYFALNVREKSSNQNTLTLLRQELLSTLINDWHSNMTFTYRAKRRLATQKVLIIFDDVTCFSQIEFLIGDLNCLGRGSCIIITTRNKQVLRNCRVDECYIYKIEGLSHCGALQLFSRHAFGQNHPQKDYGALSDRVVEYAKGIPLALKVLGCFLLDKSKEVWESAISKLEIIPHEDIQKVLKVSYDGLDDTEKNIFLDIACFLKWENKDFAIEFLDACGFYAKLGISVLIDMCLVTISNDNKIMMHDLLQEMGWEIVRQESMRDPSERSRLWYHEDINSVLEENTGTKTIEGICLDMSKQKEIIYLQPGALALMRKLRFFKLHNPQYEENNINKVHVSEDLNSISTELRYLCWQGCPLKSLQSNFRPRNLIALDMPHSNIEQLLPGHQLHKLKHIDLSYSKNLRIQDLSLAPNLESLILEGCTNLFKISSSIRLESLKKAILSCCSKFKIFDPEISSNIEELFLDETAIEELPASIENLSKLVRLNLKNCTMLENLPSNICKLKSLEYLILSGCSKLDGLPDNIGNLEALKVLEAERIGKMAVPSSIVHLRRLMELNLTNCCIKELPDDLGQLSSLESLLLGRNFFESIPASIINLSKLSYLDLSFCERLKSLPKLPHELEGIDAHNCTSLKEVSNLPHLLCDLECLDAHGWTAEEVSSSLSTRFPKTILRNLRVNFSNCYRMDQNVLEEVVEDAMLEIQPNKISMGIRSKIKGYLPHLSACICFSGIEIPNWFNFQSEGSSVTCLEASVPYGSKICGFAVCAIVEFQNYHNERQGLVVGYDYKFRRSRRNRTEVLHRGALKGWDYGTGPEFVDSHQVFLGFDFRLQLPKNISYLSTLGATIQFYVEDLNAKRIGCCNVKKCGAYFIYDEEMSPIKVTSPFDKKVDKKKEKEKEKEKEETHSKRLKISNSFKGESSSR